LKKLLFVCSGNTCRSPLAEGIAKKIFPEELLKEVEITSAGSSALDGLPASTLAIQVAGKHSVDLTEHKATLLNKSLVTEADLIITMASSHRDTVGVIEPSALEYTYVLTALCDEESGDIPDPIGLGVAEYEKTYRIVEKCLRQFVKKLGSFDGWKKDDGDTRTGG
jgi:protein-tyrosine-phosphatase